MPSQSKFSSGPLPSHTPHSSTSDEPPQTPAQSKVLPAQSHVPSAIPGPSHTPHSSNEDVPLTLPAQSVQLWFQ